MLPARRVRLLAAAAAVAGLAAVGSSCGTPGDAPSAEEAARPAASGGSGASAGSGPAGSAGAAAATAAAPLGFGRDALPAEVARLDIDVMPDGTGLPPGSGTAVEGAPLYRAQCAACHGADGEGTPLAGALVGRNPDDAFDWADRRGGQPPRTIGNYWPWATTIFDYTRRAMPFDRPGTLSDDEVYALTAWMLWKNGLIDEREPMDPRSLPDIVMPARDRFVPDDREETNRVR